MQEEEEIVLILSSISDLFIELEWINCPFSLFSCSYKCYLSLHTLSCFSVNSFKPSVLVQFDKLSYKLRIHSTKKCKAEKKSLPSLGCRFCFN